jgi:UDP-N-acetylglucosamine 2-epimerase (hydrolysing)
MHKKKILFLTGTRADFGKIKPLIQAVKEDPEFNYVVFATGMHVLAKYGNTVEEIKIAGFGDHLFTYINQMEGDSMEVVLANTILGLTRYINENPVDLIVIHGDRIEALAGAATGALRNVLVAHVEGGEVSGTIDDLIRHSTTKLSHIHFVASETAERRLQQLGEQSESIFKIGSPDLDIMFSDKLPSIEEVFKRYDIKFREYAIGMFHPVTTEVEVQYKHGSIFAEAIKDSGQNYVLIYPNNDLGSEDIFRAYDVHLKDCPNIQFFPSLRFEYFLTLLKHANFLIGNSSAGIHEAPAYGVPTINIGSRQDNRFHYESIQNVPFLSADIQAAIGEALKVGRYPRTNHYGDGNSAVKFMEALHSTELWEISKQKRFKDLAIQLV